MTNLEVKPLSDITNLKPADAVNKADDKSQGVLRRERGPPTDGVPSKTKVMVANLPFDFTEEDVSLVVVQSCVSSLFDFDVGDSSRNFSRHISPPRPKLPCALFLVL